MAVSTTPNLALPYPDGTEQVSLGPTDFQGIVQKLDGGTSGPTAMLYTKGALAARPVATTVPIGGVYDCTDVQAAFYSDGTNWNFIPKGGGISPVGAITAYCGTTDPADADGTSRWALCNGRALSRVTYVNLFNAIGTRYGTGDGSTTFNIPDTRQKFLLGKASSGTGNTLGGSGGDIDHTHSLSAAYAKVGFAQGGDLFMADSGGGGGGTFFGNFHWQIGNTIGNAAGNVPGTPLAGSPVTNNPPYLVVNYVIRII